MADLIDRQNAIDAIVGILTSGQALEAERRINRLPSAQPERKTDNSCDGCAFIGCYDTDYPCATCVRRNKDYFTPTPKMEVEHELSDELV